MMIEVKLNIGTLFLLGAIGGLSYALCKQTKKVKELTEQKGV